MKQNILMKNINVNIIIFSDDQVTVARREDEIQRAVKGKVVPVLN
jgi:hypothetical protein